jgi:regulatory protein
VTNSTTTTAEITKKLEHYCAYQERCHEEVMKKLYDFSISYHEKNEIISHLITHNFLNEERFACAFARGKFNIKKWGKIRIVNELKFRHISKYNIDKALKEIEEETYYQTFHVLAEKQWETIQETNLQKKKKKFCDYLLRKGWESHWVYEKLNELTMDN